MTIKEQIERERDCWSQLRSGAHVIHEFVLRNGQAYEGQDLPSTFKLRVPKHCFWNARKTVNHSGKLRYCEGFCRRRDFTFLFHHAWAITRFGEVIDPTLQRNGKSDGSMYDYFGIWFDKKHLTEETEATGLLAGHAHFRVDFMVKFDHGFQTIVDRIAANHENCQIVRA